MRLVRHAIQPDEPLVPIDLAVQRRYHEWLAEKAVTGISFTLDQRAWLDAIRDHIVKSLAIEPEDFDEVPFSQLGGLGKAYELFGERLAGMLDEVNEALAA